VSDAKVAPCDLAYVARRCGRGAQAGVGEPEEHEAALGTVVCGQRAAGRAVAADQRAQASRSGDSEQFQGQVTQQISGGLFSIETAALFGLYNASLHRLDDATITAP
jgi:hypothetical protein